MKKPASASQQTERGRRGRNDLAHFVHAFFHRERSLVSRHVQADVSAKTSVTTWNSTLNQCRKLQSRGMKGPEGISKLAKFWRFRQKRQNLGNFFRPRHGHSNFATIAQSLHFGAPKCWSWRKAKKLAIFGLSLRPILRKRGQIFSS